MTLAECKDELVKAHRDGDWQLARELSQMREQLKRERFCAHPECGVRINRKARHCSAHANHHPQHKRKLK